MLYHAKNGQIKLQDAQTDYIRFGNGGKTLILLPGLGDGLRSVKGTALPMALMYRSLAKQYTVYAFSRKNPLPPGYTTRDMARDLKGAMDTLGISRADVLGVSMGGMIAQHLAVDHPETVGKLVLAVTCAGPNSILAESVAEWISLAQKNDHTALMESNLRRIYSQDYYRKNKWLLPILGKVTKPKSYDRFFVQSNACLTHDVFDSLCRIQSPTLVIGGEQDLALGGDASVELAQQIPGAQLHMYPQWGHGLYEEASDFLSVVLEFLK